MVAFSVFATNVYRIDLPFTKTLARDQRHCLLIAFPNENILLNSDTSHPDQFVCFLRFGNKNYG